MAKGDMTILDMQIDMATGKQLEKVNVVFKLDTPRRKWLVFRELAWSYRERVRDALRAQWSRAYSEMPPGWSPCIPGAQHVFPDGLGRCARCSWAGPRKRGESVLKSTP